MKIDEIELEVIKDYSILDHMVNYDSLEFTDKELTNYFSKFKYRGVYYVAMKAVVALKLHNKGYTLARIAEIIFGDRRRHDTIHHYLYHFEVDKQISKELRNWKMWINNGLYPTTKPNHLKREVKHKDGWREISYCVPELLLKTETQINKKKNERGIENSSINLH